MSTKKKPWRRNYKRELEAVAQPGSLQGLVRPLRCPWCGTKPKLIFWKTDKGWTAGCEGKKCPVNPFTHLDNATRQQAIQTWNLGCRPNEKWSDRP